jgi:hypothetical protein
MCPSCPEGNTSSPTDKLDNILTVPNLAMRQDKPWSEARPKITKSLPSRRSDDRNWNNQTTALDGQPISDGLCLGLEATPRHKTPTTARGYSTSEGEDWGRWKR